MDLKKIHSRLQAEFRAKKIKAEATANYYNLKLNAVPAYQKLCTLERALIFDIAKNKSNKISCKELEANLAEVQAQKQVIFKKLGITKKHLTPKYKCEICKDTGMIGEQICACYRKRRNEELLAECGMQKDAMATFEKFDTANFADKAQAKNLETIKDKLVDWANRYPKVKKLNIIIRGTTGVGKTFLTECLASYLISKGYSVCYLTAFEVNNLMQKYHTTFDSSKQTILSPLIHSDFLFVDDLGTEPMLKNVTLNYLYLIISEREKLKKPIIITTNLTPETLMHRYEERIYSRLSNNAICAKFHITGEDLRRK